MISPTTGDLAAIPLFASLSLEELQELIALEDLRVASIAIADVKRLLLRYPQFA